MHKSIFQELTSMHSPTSLDARGENAWGVAIKFLGLLEENVSDEVERKKLMASWIKAIKENDYKKFKRALRRYSNTEEDKYNDEESNRK